MECAPFGVNVLLVVPGSVTSNISSHSAFRVRPGSPWEKWEPAMLQRLIISQGQSTMPTDKFAAQVVKRALYSPKSWRRFVAGGMTWTLWFVEMLPRYWGLGMLWSSLSKN